MDEREPVPHDTRSEAHTFDDALYTVWDSLNKEYEGEVEKIHNAQAIFILGGSTLWPVWKARELYNRLSDEGVSPKVAFISSGGRFGGQETFGMNEYEKYREELIKGNVPPEDILTVDSVEDSTTNTLMEAQQAIPFLQQKGLDLKKIILVSRPLHQRRAWATFTEQHPEIEYVNVPSDEPLEFGDPEVRERLLAEVDRLAVYGQKGDISVQPLPPEVEKAVAYIREHHTGNPAS